MLTGLILWLIVHAVAFALAGGFSWLANHIAEVRRAR